MQVRKQQLELDMEQQTGSKQEKKYAKAVYCHPAYLTYMRSTSWETLGWRKQRSSRKRFTSALSTNLKPSVLWIITNYGKFLRRWEYQTTLPDFWEVCMQVKKQQLELDMEQKTGLKLGKA